MANADVHHMITSKEILDKTGISRATLNNYIKMGILPKPIVRKPESDLGSVRQIGYFPVSVLDRIEMVKRYKRGKETMEEIAKKIKSDESLPVTEMWSHKVPEKEPTSSQISGISISGTDKKHMGLSGLKLTIEAVPYPAFLVNRHLEVEWINSAAEEQVFNQSVSMIGDPVLKNLFTLFFGTQFTSQVKNWETVITHHVPFVHSCFSKDRIRDLYKDRSASEIRLLENAWDDSSGIPAEYAHSARVNIVRKDDQTAYYRIQTMSFIEGIFFLYIPQDQVTDDRIDASVHISKTTHDASQYVKPALTSLCVLVVDLQDAEKIGAELIPEEYFELVNQIWKTLHRICEKYGAVFGPHTNSDRTYYFIKDDEDEYLMNAICCALAIKEKIKVIDREWKVRKGWMNDLCINIGMDAGQVFFGTVGDASGTAEYSALGDAVNYAKKLSDFACNGSVWTTRSVMSRLRPDDIHRVRFGVNRIQQDQRTFNEKSFCRIIDWAGPDARENDRLLDIAVLPITEIVSCDNKVLGEKS